MLVLKTDSSLKVSAGSCSIFRRTHSVVACRVAYLGLVCPDSACFQTFLERLYLWFCFACMLRCRWIENVYENAEVHKRHSNALEKMVR